MNSSNGTRIAFAHLDVFLWAMVGDFMREHAETLGATVTIWNAVNVDDQVTGLAKLIDEKIDAIIVAPVTSDHPGLLQQVAHAQACGIPVLIIDSEIAGAESLPYLGSDHLNGGALIAKHLFDHLHGQARVAHIQGRLPLASHNLRSQGFHRAREHYPDVEVVFEKSHDPSMSFENTGRTYAREIIALRPTPHAIVTATDRIALGAIEVLEAAGLSKKILVTGFDGIPHALRAIRQESMFGTVSQNVSNIARQALDLAGRMIQGKPVTARTLIATELVTRVNVVDAALDALHYMPGMLDRVAEDNRLRRGLQLELTENLKAQTELIVTLKTSEERFRSLTKLSSDWYWEQDENFRFVITTDSNDGGVFPEPNVGKLRWELPFVDVPEHLWAEHKATLMAHLPFRDLELKRIDRNGVVRHVTISGHPNFDKNGKFIGYYGISKDITERKKAEEKIEYLAYHDALTTLPNRDFFLRQVHRALVQAKRYRKRFAVLFIDLDRFKNINDALGHEAGDQLLQEVATRLRDCLREGDIVARFGGDEFVVLLEELSEQNYVAVVAQKILSNIMRSLSLHGSEYQITASIGISTFPDDGQDEQILMKNADIAMYTAKEKGKNNFEFYSAQDSAHLFERLTLESYLRRAMEKQEFLLHYQPKVNIASGCVTGVEALVRWRHPRLGLVSPAQFIPLAEETGLIVPIGKWVLRAACLKNVEWQNRGIRNVRLAVNLSPRQFFDEHLVDDIAQTLEETGMESRLLELEITESMVTHSTDKAIALLLQLKAMGIYLAIDDFGTGYSSFGLLKNFPIDTIKIDRSFIKDVPGNDADNELAGAMISMGKALNLTIVAEGVENKEQCEFLRRHACDEMQGFYFSKPLPADDVELILKENIAKFGGSETGSAQRATRSTPGTSND